MAIEPLTTEPRVYTPGHKTDVVYHEYLCSGCGKAANNCYMEPSRTQMLERRLCWDCNYWRAFEERLTRDHASMTIIEGHVYGPGSRTSGSFRGMAGRRFDIEYVAPSVHAGKRITTFDLWSGSTLPAALKARFADTARFLGGAEKARAGDTTCWNPSDHKGETYPLPNTLALK